MRRGRLEHIVTLGPTPDSLPWIQEWARGLLSAPRERGSPSPIQIKDRWAKRPSWPISGNATN
jgi:hypothetical protein